MKPKQPKRVRCWMVRQSGTGFELVTSNEGDAALYADRYPRMKVTPGYFVPDEPKAKKRSKR